MRTIRPVKRSSSRWPPKALALTLSCMAVALTACVGTGLGGDRSSAQPPEGGPSHSLISTVGVFDDYNEILRGTTFTDRRLKVNFFDFQGVVSGIRCVGHGRVTVIPPGVDLVESCEGVKGLSTVTCSDGRMLETEYRLAPECGVAHGVGVDQFGNTLSFVYGLPEKEAEEAVRREMRRASKRAPLEIYRPSEVRAAQGYSTGTAFAIDGSGHFVTSHHVVAGTDRIWLVDPEGDEHPVVYVRGDAENDVALLRAEELAADALPVKPSKRMQKGERVLALGYPLVAIQGQEQKATFGRVNALSGAMGDERFLQVDTPIQPGNSGGPLLDEYGNVVGIVTATLNQAEVMRSSGTVAQNVNYALRTEYLFALLEADGKRDVTPTASIQMDDRSFAAVVERAEGSVFLVVARPAE